jgi:two-component system phosphate regulon sensor histidine kinase PhoR
MALRNVVESVCQINQTDIPVNNPVDQVSQNYFIVRTDSRIELESLEYLLKAELEKRAIREDFEYGVYDCQNDQMVFGNLVSYDTRESTQSFPELTGFEYYFGVYFPERSTSLLLGQDTWKWTTAITVIVLVFFGYALFIVLRQKKLSTIQRDFVNNITHEFKTPLATLRVAADVLSDEKTPPARSQKYAGLVRKETDRLEKHVSQLLKSAVIENREQTEIESFDLTEMVTTMVESFREQHQTRTFHLDLPDSITVRTDGYLLETILYNLIDNAAKYGTSEIWIALHKDPGQLQISVQDDGPGINARETKRIFQKFYRSGNQDEHNVKGFGIGLFVVRRAVRLLGGKIDLLTHPRTTFNLTIPCP